MQTEAKKDIRYINQSDKETYDPIFDNGCHPQKKPSEWRLILSDENSLQEIIDENQKAVTKFKEEATV